jgi:hypothetical protein
MSHFWLNTATGRAFDFLDPKPEDIDIVDIAVALSHQARYAGHTRVHYSVASHSMIIANTLDVLDYPQEVVAWGLLHDAAEAYVTDIPWPLKAAGLVPEIARVEKAIMVAIVERFSLGSEEPEIVKLLDLEILDVCQDSHVIQRVSPAFYRVIADGLRLALRDEHKTFAPAGNASSRYYSRWQGTCDDVARWVAKHPGATLRELLAEVRTHYASAASARSSLTKWIELGKVAGVRMERDGKAVRLFPEVRP